MKNQPKTAQMQEVETRIKMLGKIGLYHTAVTQFLEDGRLNFTYPGGILFKLDDDVLENVREFEKKHDCIVYHVIFSPMEFGECYSYLYVSKYEEEWERDRNDLQEGLPLAYVWNKTDERCSEFGCIQIRPLNGGIFRIG